MFEDRKAEVEEVEMGWSWRCLGEIILMVIAVTVGEVDAKLGAACPWMPRDVMSAFIT